MNKYERQGYVDCILDYKEHGLRYCREQELYLFKLNSNQESYTYKGYHLALEDLLDKTVLI